MLVSDPDFFERPDESIRERFDREGFVLLKEFFAPEILSRYEPLISRQVARHRQAFATTEMSQSTYDRAFVQVVNLWKMDAGIKEFVFGKELARAAAHLLGVDSVRLYHDQALYKAPGGGITPWHADQFYWPLASDLTCTAWIPLQDTPPEMGSLSFSVGSHRLREGRDIPISDESEMFLEDLLTQEGLPIFEEAFALGDVSFHKGWTFHRAGPNESSEVRKAMTIIYMADGITVGPCRRAEHDADQKAFLPERFAGDLANTPMNPVLYP